MRILSFLSFAHKVTIFFRYNQTFSERNPKKSSLFRNRSIFLMFFIKFRPVRATYDRVNRYTQVALRLEREPRGEGGRT